MSVGLPRVLIADDHALMAEGIAGLLRPHYEVIGICSNGRDMIKSATLMKPAAIVFDIGMPEMNGIEAARRLHRDFPRLRLICVTQQVDQQYLSAALLAGATGFVSKQSASDELLLAIQSALRGGTYITPSLEAVYRDRQFGRPRAVARNEGYLLTPRQREVLQLVAEGKQSKEIASLLNISLKTVEFHRSALIGTLGLRSAAELTRYALAHGLIQ